MKSSDLRLQQKTPAFSALIRTCTLACVLLVAGRHAHANFFCVSTAAQLQSALTDASDGGMYNGEDNEIYLVVGTYKTGAATGGMPFHYSSTAAHFIHLYGGNGLNCNGYRQTASLTVLDGNAATGVMAIASQNGSVTVANLTLQNGESTTPGAGLRINYLVSPNAIAFVHNTIIRNNHSTSFAGGLYLDGAGLGTTLAASLIESNSSDTGVGGALMLGYGNYNIVQNVTVVKNTSGANNPIGGLECGGSARCDIYNSIFGGNTQYGLYLLGSNARLYYNGYGTLGGMAPGYSQGNLPSVSPQFVDFTNGDFHLAEGSPLLGAARPGPDGLVDLDNHLIPYDGKLDIGAYQDTIFGDDL